MSNMFAITKCRVHSSNRKLKIYFQSLISFKEELTWINIYDGSEFDLIFNYLQHHYHQLLTIFRLICWQRLEVEFFLWEQTYQKLFPIWCQRLEVDFLPWEHNFCRHRSNIKVSHRFWNCFSRSFWSKIFVNSSLRILFPRTSKSIHLSSFLELVLFIIRWSLFINVDHLLIKKHIEKVVEFQYRS